MRPCEPSRRNIPPLQSSSYQRHLPQQAEDLSGPAIESTSSGAIQMVDEGAAQFGQFVAAFSILEAPYIWRDPAHMRKTLDDPSIVAPMNAALRRRSGAVASRR